MRCSFDSCQVQAKVLKESKAVEDEGRSRIQQELRYQQPQQLQQQQQQQVQDEDSEEEDDDGDSEEDSDEEDDRPLSSMDKSAKRKRSLGAGRCMFKCSYCEYRSKNEHVLKRHMEQVRTSVCNVCNTILLFFCGKLSRFT